LETIANNYQDWNVEEDEEIKVPTKKRCILTLSEETMKEATKTIKEKGIKTSDLKELSEKGIKFPIDEPCFPIQVHSISDSMGDGKPTNDIDVSYVNYSHYQHGFNRSIKLSLEENDRKIKFLRESLSSSIESIKGVVKHCTMINNQIEQLSTLQNTLFEQISYNANKACAI